MKQTWHDLLFAHWPAPPEKIRPLVPLELELDLFDGSCWIGVVPFRMSGVRARWLPTLPALSRFPELNLRTYVNCGDKPGVYFFSLDAANRAAVWAARKFFHLPYFDAAMSSQDNDGTIHYSSRRSRAVADLRASYRPTSPEQPFERWSLERWLTERYCLYAVHDESVYRCEIHHQKWPLQDAEAEFESNTVASAAGIELSGTASSLLFARRLEVLIWPLRRAAETSPRV